MSVAFAAPRQRGKGEITPAAIQKVTWERLPGAGPRRGGVAGSGRAVVGAGGRRLPGGALWRLLYSHKSAGNRRPISPRVGWPRAAGPGEERSARLRRRSAPPGPHSRKPKPGVLRCKLLRVEALPGELGNLPQRLGAGKEGAFRLGASPGARPGSVPVCSR